MIIYWQLYHFNGVALIQVTEPWNICSEIKNNTEQMEGYTMFLDWKKQYCENDYTTQSNLQIQCNSYETTNGIFQRTRTKIFYNSYGNTKDPEEPKQS